MPSFNKPTKKPKYGRRIVIILVLLILRRSFTKHVTLNQKIVLMKGESISTLLKPLSSRERTRIKVYIKMHHVDFSKIEAGTYEFSGSYSRSNFTQTILAGPTNKYVRITVLEGRSMYDIDNSLSKKGLIQPGEYKALVTDTDIIIKYATKYKFLEPLMLDSNRTPHTLSLEGFLYPDTYNVDAGDNIVDQLVYLQLENFKKRVREKVSDSIGKNGMGRYEDVILASILEKEERNIANKATVAGIFLRRLEIGMKLDADITLCYGLQTPYESCTPAVIGRNISDKNNPYNTRQLGGLTPRPISNPTAESILAVLNPQPSSYLYYLHDMKGNIHYGSTLEEHNANKTQYLQ